MYGSVTAAVRGMSATEIGRDAHHAPMVCASPSSSPWPWRSFGFVWPGDRDLAALLINGAFNGVGQYLWTRSLSLAPPAAVGPFYYFSLVWAMILGFVFWGDVPTPLTAAWGSAVVVGSGLFLLWHERGKKPVAEPTEI